MRYISPASMTGLEITHNTVNFSCRFHRYLGLSYNQGSAEKPFFPDESFDAVINVESSHCYENLSCFSQEVCRVLHPGGYFLYADHRMNTELPAWREQTFAPGFMLLEEEILNSGVVRALELDNHRRVTLVTGNIPQMIECFYREFASIEGSLSQYANLTSGKKVYTRFVLQKNHLVFL